MNYDRLISSDSVSTNSTIDTPSLEPNSPIFPYYKPVLTSEARARTLPNGYHVKNFVFFLITILLYFIQ